MSDQGLNDSLLMNNAASKRSSSEQNSKTTQSQSTIEINAKTLWREIKTEAVKEPIGGIHDYAYKNRNERFFAQDTASKSFKNSVYKLNKFGLSPIIYAIWADLNNLQDKIKVGPVLCNYLKTLSTEELQKRGLTDIELFHIFVYVRKTSCSFLFKQRRFNK